MRQYVDSTGFTPPADRRLGRERRAVAFAELMASIGIALCTVIAVTVVSAGIARASVASDVIDHEGSLFAIALVLGLLFIAVGGISMLSRPVHKPRRQKT